MNANCFATCLFLLVAPSDHQLGYQNVKMFAHNAMGLGGEVKMADGATLLEILNWEGVNGVGRKCVAWYGIVWQGMAWYGVVCYGTVRHDIARHTIFR